MYGCSTQTVNLNPSMKASGFTHVLGLNWAGQLTSKKLGFICNLFAPLPHSRAGTFFFFFYMFKRCNEGHSPSIHFDLKMTKNLAF